MSSQYVPVCVVYMPVATNTRGPWAAVLRMPTASGYW
jgi:hypothetical protein